MTLNMFPGHFFTITVPMIAPAPAVPYPAITCSCNVQNFQNFIPPLMDYLSHSLACTHHHHHLLPISDTAMYNYSGHHNPYVPSSPMSEMPEVVYHKMLRQLGQQAEFEMLKRSYPHVTFLEVLKEAWGFPTHTVEEATLGSAPSVPNSPQPHLLTLNSPTYEPQPQLFADPVPETSDFQVQETASSNHAALREEVVLASEVVEEAPRFSTPLSTHQELVPYHAPQAQGLDEEGEVVVVIRRRGSSTVAIDNKIEQAMDLVKSHLMYAVREEVEVLKEQIKELMERLSQLEYENNILRAAATPDTLAKLTSTPQSAQPPSSSTSSS